MTIEDLIAKYVQLRDRKEAAERAQKEQLKPLLMAMNKLEGVLLKALNDLGGEAASIKTAHGTAFVSHKTAAKVQDWESFFVDYVLPNKAYEMITKSCNKTAVAEYVEANKTPPPGIEWTRVAEVRINRPRPK